MNFRLVWMGPDDDPNGYPPVRAHATAAPPRSAAPIYERRGTGMIRRQHLENGRVKDTVLANFSARIVRDLVLDDDAEQRHEVSMEAEVGEHKLAFVIPAAEFARMGWVPKQLGPQAIIYPGQQQHARAAIQRLSGPIRQERIFTHLGWTKQGAQWLYLQAGGAVGAHGLRCDVHVQLPAALEHYHVQTPAEAGERVSAVRASLRFLALAPDRISFPLLAAVYRAALGQVNFSLFLTGQTGTFKTTLAALCQQHFGAEMDASQLPANFASTANALEDLAFTAKDALLVVDDFVPIGGPGDGTLQGVAERLFRAVGNRQGRSRMGGNGRVRSSRPPRALVLATGEEVPRGESLRARLLVVEVRAGEVDRTVLDECQEAASQGRLAAAMGAFLCWTAGRYEQVRQELGVRARELRNHYRGAAHPRLPATVAELQCGFEIWLQFALEIGAISALELAQLKQRNVKALGELLALQIQYHQAADPALRFVSLLRAALATGRAHVANRLGKAPESPAIWGWRPKPSGRGWVSQGARIGWMVGSDLFLEPATSYQVARELAGTDRLVGEQTLRHRLRERGLLASIDGGRQMVQVRRTLEGIPRQVLHLKASVLVELRVKASRTFSLQPPAGHNKALVKRHIPT